MTIGTSLFLIALGAILRFAVSVSTRGFNIQTIGLILMIIGGVGLLLSLLWMSMWRDRRVAGPRYVERDPRYVERDPRYVERDPRYVEREVPPADGY